MSVRSVVTRIVVRSRPRITTRNVLRLSEKDELEQKLARMWSFRKSKWRSQDRSLFKDSRGNLIDDSSDERRSEVQRRVKPTL